MRRRAGQTFRSHSELRLPRPSWPKVSKVHSRQGALGFGRAASRLQEQLALHKLHSSGFELDRANGSGHHDRVGHREVGVSGHGVDSEGATIVRHRFPQGRMLPSFGKQKSCLVETIPLNAITPELRTLITQIHEFLWAAPRLR